MKLQRVNLPVELIFSSAFPSSKSSNLLPFLLGTNPSSILLPLRNITGTDSSILIAVFPVLNYSSLIFTDLTSSVFLILIFLINQFLLILLFLTSYRTNPKKNDLTNPRSVSAVDCCRPHQTVEQYLYNWFILLLSLLFLVLIFHQQRICCLKISEGQTSVKQIAVRCCPVQLMRTILQDMIYEKRRRIRAQNYEIKMNPDSV